MEEFWKITCNVFFFTF